MIWHVALEGGGDLVGDALTPMQSPEWYIVGISKGASPIGRAVMSIVKRTMSETPNPEYIVDLLRRMDTEEHVPDGGSSADTTSFKAFREAETLSDISLLPQINERVLRVKKSREFIHLSFILSRLIRNTGNTEAIGLYLHLAERSPRTREPTMYLIAGARKAKIKECRDFVLQHLNTKHGIVLSEVIEYLGLVGDETDIPTIGKLLDADCNGLCHPMYCIFAMEAIGHKDAIPYLQRPIERHKHSRTKVQRETRRYAEAAIPKLA